eukprot:PhM_4_TR4670/c0_g1_i1/m.35745/K00036/G6PD, zwf; glucose-6-phosphate 1-dehydrogenase
MLSGERPADEEAYMASHPRVFHIFRNLSDAIAKARPEDPEEFLISELKKLRDQTKAKPPDDLTSVYVPKVMIPESKRDTSRRLSIVVFGASGDLSRKKTLPALHALYYEGLLPTDVIITGYNRSVLNKAEFMPKVAFKKFKHHESMEAFSRNIDFVSGSYDKDEDFQKLDQVLREREGGPANRIFYLALPPTIFVSAATGIKKCLTGNDGWSRLIVEKPFGRDSASSNALAKSLNGLFREEQIYRIDHYLGKEMVQNIIGLRFANKVFSEVWNRNAIHNVQITFKETFGTEGRGGYFDTFGIIRDVMQNHLLQIVALIAMEPPKSLDPEQIRDEKVAVLRCVDPLKLEDTVLGQYAANPNSGKPGYLDDPTVPAGSNTPTFATTVLNIHNDRWHGVPFILKAGKALDDKIVVIRIQFREQILPYGLGGSGRNELVIRCQPNEAMYVKVNAKTPGLDTDLVTTELDLTYNSRFCELELPEAYASLIYDATVGNSTNFVRTDELEVAWNIFTPILHDIDAGKVKPIPYKYGTRGPQESDDLIKRCGYVRNTEYAWSVCPVTSGAAKL